MPTVVITANTSGGDYSGVSDTRLNSTSQTTNYGTNSTLEATKYAELNHQHTLIAFTGLSNITGPVTVTSATLSLYLESASGSTYTCDARRLLRNWVEAQATWLIWSTGNNWSTDGGISDGNDRSATISGTSSVGSTTGQYYDFTGATLTADVEGFINGSLSNYGWHIARDDAGEDFAYRVFTSSNGTDAQRPKLTVVYTSGRTTKNTRAWPLGTEIGMNWRVEV